MRRLSCRSVPMMCSPPSAGHLAPLGLHLRLVPGDGLLPDILGHIEPRLVLRPAVLVGLALQIGPGHELGVAAQDDVGAAAGHVGRDRHAALAPGLGHDLGLALVILGVQDLVRDAEPAQVFGQLFRLLDRRRAHQDRPARLVDLLDLVEDGADLLALGPEDHVGEVVPGQGPVGRDRDHVQAVDLVELGRLGHGRAGHARQLLVQLEEVLQGDRGQRLVLFLDLDPLLGLDGLVQPVGPLAADHQPAGELVDDHHLAVGLNHVIAVAAVEVMGLERIVDQVGPFHVAGRVEALDAGDLLGLADAVVVQVAGAFLLLDLEMGVAPQQPGDPVGLGVLAHVVEGRSRR